MMVIYRGALKKTSPVVFFLKKKKKMIVCTIGGEMDLELFVGMGNI